MNQLKPSLVATPFSEFSASQGINIDIKRIIYQALRFWYLIVLFLGVSLTVAFLKNRYAVRIYPVTASILIKESEETSEGRLLYNNPLVSGFRNYLNELYIIKSYPLIGKAIENLGFEAAFYKEGNFLTTEAYEYLPVNAVVLRDSSKRSLEFYFEVVNEHEFKLKRRGIAIEGDKSDVFKFGDTLVFESTKFLFQKTAGNIQKFYGQDLLFRYTPSERLTGSYVDRLNASWAEEGSGVILLSINGSNPNKEIDFLNGLIKQYQANDLEKKNQTASRTIDFITDQLNNISDSLRDAERQLEAFKAKNVITDLGAEAQRLYEKVEALELQKTELIIKESYYKYLREYIANDQGLDQIILPASIGISDAILDNLIGEMVSTQNQIKTYSKQSSGNALVKEKLKIIDQLKRNITESINNQEKLDQIKKGFLEKQIHEVEKVMNRLPIVERQLVSIKRNYALMESLYIFLLQKRAEAGISKASTTTDIIVVNPPMQIGGPISPKTSQNYVIAILIGLGLPLLVLIVLELTNTRVQSREDIEKLSTIPFIGGIGHKKGEINLEVLNGPKSAIAESFRALRSNLTYFTGNKPKIVFMVTSSISGEGKSFTSINLASVFALSGLKTLIIGADLRKPKLFADFNLSNQIGLSNYLSGMVDYESTIQPTQFENLYLVSGGPIPPNPSELLLSPAMGKFMERAKQDFDCIVLDTPPIAIVTDAFALADFSDHILFMVRQNHTPKILLKNVEDFYSTGKLKNISIVLNDIYKSGPGYGYGYGYGGYGYGYGYQYGRGSGKNGYGYYTE